MTHHPTKITLTLAAALLAAFLLTGCSDDSATPAATATGGDDFQALDFSDPYGGLTASDEAVAFDDDALLAMTLAEDGQEVVDNWADDPMVREMERMGGMASDPGDSLRPHFTFVHLRWGMLRDLMDTVAVEPPCDVTDWTGAINVDRGVLLVRRVIRFERPLDHIIFPRLDRQTVGLVSRTACGFDGVVLQILERPEADPAAEPNMLHIALGDFSLDVAVTDLVGLDEVHEVGDNKVALVGFGLSDIAYCPKGFLDGMFRRMPVDRPDSLASERPGTQYGVFAGMWRELDGRLHGHLRGGYGVDEDGNRIFVGKYIGPRGGFRGLIRGTWEPGAADDLMAAFRGQWFGRDGQAEGLLGGEAFAVDGSAGGFFSGRWTALCDDEAEDAVR